MVDAAIILIVIFLFIGLGVGVYFLMKSGKKCPDNCSDQSCSNNMCTTCSSGYGIDSSGTPDTDGSCPEDTSCPTGCNDTKCTKNVCKNCNGGTPNSDGSCPSYTYTLLTADTSATSTPYGGACRITAGANTTSGLFDMRTTNTLSECQDLCNNSTSTNPCYAVSYVPPTALETNNCGLANFHPVFTGQTVFKDEVCYKKN